MHFIFFLFLLLQGCTPQSNVPYVPFGDQSPDPDLRHVFTPVKPNKAKRKLTALETTAIVGGALVGTGILATAGILTAEKIRDKCHEVLEGSNFTFQNQKTEYEDFKNKLKTQVNQLYQKQTQALQDKINNHPNEIKEQVMFGLLTIKAKQAGDKFAKGVLDLGVLQQASNKVATLQAAFPFWCIGNQKYLNQDRAVYTIKNPRLVFPKDWNVKEGVKRAFKRLKGDMLPQKYIEAFEYKAKTDNNLKDLFDHAGHLKPGVYHYAVAVVQDPADPTRWIIQKYLVPEVVQIKEKNRTYAFDGLFPEGLYAAMGRIIVEEGAPIRKTGDNLYFGQSVEENFQQVPVAEFLDAVTGP